MSEENLKKKKVKNELLYLDYINADFRNLKFLFSIYFIFILYNTPIYFSIIFLTFILVYITQRSAQNDFIIAFKFKTWILFLPDEENVIPSVA